MELEDIHVCITNSAIILNDKILHSLHQLTLNISSVGGFYGCVNKTLTARHGVEEEFRWSQATNERVLDEATSLGAVIVLLEVGEGAILEAIRDALALNVLLPNTRNHLRNIDGTTLGSSTNHRRHAVLGAQRRLANLACQLRRLVQDAEHLVLQLITIRLARVIVKEILVNLEEQCLNLCLASLDLLVHLLLR